MMKVGVANMYGLFGKASPFEVERFICSVAIFVDIASAKTWGRLNKNVIDSIDNFRCFFKFKKSLHVSGVNRGRMKVFDGCAKIKLNTIFVFHVDVNNPFHENSLHEFSVHIEARI
jgi:hypothetical protein